MSPRSGWKQVTNGLPVRACLTTFGEIPRLVGNATERLADHPCQLPEILLERVIEASTTEGDLVMDCMAGTGTTLRVAQRLNRRYLGIEQQSQFVDLIRTRLRQDYQKVLFS